MPVPLSFNDYGPITWFRRKPIYLTTILVGVFVLGMLVTVLLAATQSNWMVFAFSPNAFWHGAFWQLFTYPLVAMPSISFAINLFFFLWFGADVERYLGRVRYTQLLAMLVLVSPVLQSLWLQAGVSRLSAGCGEITMGFFIAYVTLYPDAELWGMITMKWLAVILVGISALSYVAVRDWPGLTNIAGACAVGFGYTRFIQRGGSLELPAAVKNLFNRRPKLSVVPKPDPGDNVHESIDPLLDKISKHGISSLTAKEREQLQRARESLLKKTE